MGRRKLKDYLKKRQMQRQGQTMEWASQKQPQSGRKRVLTQTLEKRVIESSSGKP